MTIIGRMNKLAAILPLFLLSMCSDAPVTPPAGASELPYDVVCLSLDCPPLEPPISPRPPTLPRKELKGEVDIWNVNQIHQMQMMFLHNERQANIENNMTHPSDAINNALDSFWEEQNGSNDTPKS